MQALLTHTRPESLIIKPESDGATINQGLVVVAPVGDFELLLCHGTASIVRIMRDLILQLTKISIYSTKPSITGNQSWRACTTSECVGWGYASPRTCCTRWTCPDTRQFRGTVSACWMRQVCLQRSELITCEGTVIYCPPPIQSMGLPHQILLSTQSRKSYFFLRRCLDPCPSF